MRWRIALVSTAGTVGLGRDRWSGAIPLELVLFRTRDYEGVVLERGIVVRLIKPNSGVSCMKRDAPESFWSYGPVVAVP